MGQYQKAIAPTVSFESLKNLIDSCYNNKIYKLSENESKKITFVYGSQDEARLCKIRIKKHFIFKMKKYGHCGFYRENPIEWVKKFIL